MENKRKKIAFIPADKHACGYFRMLMPYNELIKLEQDEFEFDVYDTDKLDGMSVVVAAKLFSGYDAVVFQRCADKAIVELMKYARMNGSKVFMDIDDNLLNVSKYSPAGKVYYKGSEALVYFTEAMKLADGIFVSTPELELAYRHLNKNITVFPNALDTLNPKFDLNKSRRSELPEDKVVVMWTGSSTHLDSLHEIGKYLRPAFDQNPNALFALCSNPEFLDIFDIAPEQKLYVPHVPLSEFYSIPSMADIGLAPVCGNIFNEGKSELKCLEYGIWGVPTICSYSAPYKRFKANSPGGNVVMYENKSKEWAREISRLIRNEDARKKMGTIARNTILEKYDIKSVNQQRFRYFQENIPNKVM